MKRKTKTVWYGDSKVVFTPYEVGGYKYTEYCYSRINGMVVITVGREGYLNKIPKYF